ncbi:MAG: aldehyde dehydrogenase family protein [Dehalococcoidia bacterium]|nr:aldehyde dehydrogenase family protein [Dehalococcoidia bacterium]
MSLEALRALELGKVLPDGKHLIGGEWVSAQAGETIDVINPATQELLLRVPRGKEVDIDAACQAAARAFPAWRDMNPTMRANLLSRWANLLTARSEEISLLEAIEVGRPHKGRTNIGMNLQYFAGFADKITGTTLPSVKPEALGFTLREPYGVCGCIVPWNGPTTLMMNDTAPCLAAGNTLVVKPAEDAPLACLLVAKLALEAGIPPGVLNIVTGYGNEAGAALPLHPEIRRMGFTGSPETGAIVMKLCAEHLVPLHLELGGKSPQIVLRDADLEKAIPTIVRQLVSNSGQICYTGTRLLVEESMRKNVVAAVAQEMQRVRVGQWSDDADMGPLINIKQERRVLDYMEIGRDEGARLVVGGGKLAGEKFDRGFFVEPTLFDDVKPGMRIAQEEIFGPVLSTISFSDPEEAVEIANSTKYGLAASVWTNDLRRAVRVAKGIQAGQVYVNTYGWGSVIGAPFGGYKHSGFGRTHGYETILDYTQVKSVIINAED